MNNKRKLAVTVKSRSASNYTVNVFSVSFSATKTVNAINVEIITIMMKNTKKLYSKLWLEMLMGLKMKTFKITNRKDLA